MNYKEKLAEIRKKHAQKAKRDEFLAEMSGYGIPIEWTEVPLPPLPSLFKYLDKPSTLPYKEINYPQRSEWENELRDAATSFNAPWFAFCWRDVPDINNGQWLKFDRELLNRWLSSFDFDRRRTDLVCYHPSSSILVGMLAEEYVMQFKKVSISDLPRA